MYLFITGFERSLTIAGSDFVGWHAKCLRIAVLSTACSENWTGHVPPWLRTWAWKDHPMIFLISVGSLGIFQAAAFYNKFENQHWNLNIAWSVYMGLFGFISTQRRHVTIQIWHNTCVNEDNDNKAWENTLITVATGVVQAVAIGCCLLKFETLKKCTKVILYINNAMPWFRLPLTKLSSRLVVSTTWLFCQASGYLVNTNSVKWTTSQL